MCVKMWDCVISGSFKKSKPEVWWKKSASEKTLHIYSGSAVDTYVSPVLHPGSVYTLRIKSMYEDTYAHIYLHEGHAPWEVFPELPSDPRVHMLGVGMSSVTLTWGPSPSVIKSLHAHTHSLYEYCVTVNRQQNYRSLCAAQEEKGGIKDEWKKSDMIKLDRLKEHVCVCKEVESVCTISELLPNTLYYFDVFVIDRMNGTSASYVGTAAHTHTESHTLTDIHTHTKPHTHKVTLLREGKVQCVTLSSGADERQSFRFRPRGGQKNGLLTLLSCNDTHTLTHILSVFVSAGGNELKSQEVGDQLVQVWLQGFSSYLIQLRLFARNTHAAQRETVCVKIQASSAFHRRGAPALPHTLHIKSFNTLRTCSSVTLAWMGTEERGLYCLYRRRAHEQSGTGGEKVISGGQRCETGGDTVIKGRQRSETGGERVIRGGQRCETGDRVIKGRQKSETGEEKVILDAPRSETDQNVAMYSKQKSVTSGNRVIPRKHKTETDRCLAPESRPPDQRVLCKYFQELDARRAVTTATVEGLEAETLYTFDIYLIRRWALPVKYHSKTVRTRRDC